MNLACAAALAAVILLSAQSSQGAETPKKPVPRKDAYFGLHFDLHPQKTDTSLGADISEENIAELLTRVRPDYVQYDCKGHAGYTGYPTKVGTPSPGIVKDSLAIWRKVTREHGVGLYIHYSGVWDSVAMEKHPEWARIDAEGKPDKNAASTFGPYVDELMIPQLKEVCAAYDLDGLWVDGECWAAQIDYCQAAVDLWHSMDKSDPPKSREDRLWHIWKNVHRKQFENYLCRWVDALHEFNPKLQITSNWMYTTFAPKAVYANLDFLSGDYSPHLSVDRARTDARYLANTGMPWDLMAWGFNNAEGLGHSLKTAVHLQQEAAVVLMQGGGFQIYYNPTRSGYLYDEIINTASEVAKFCRARQEICHKNTSVPQVALLLSSETQFDRSDAVFTPYGTMDEMEGALHALLESHYSVDVLAEHQLLPRMREYPLIVVPDSYKLTDDFKNSLLVYAENGGNLLLLGEKCAQLFEDKLGVEFVGEPRHTYAELKTPAGVVNQNGTWQKVKLSAAEPVAYRYPSRDTRKDGDVAASVVSYGKGKISAVYGPVALNYFRSHHPYLRSFIADMAARLFPEPAVKMDAPPCVDIALRRSQSGKLTLHLLNRAGAPTSERYGVTDFIPTVGPITARIRVPEKPKNVTWVPDGGKLEWSWKSGILTVKVNSLHVHGVIVIEES